MALPRRFLNLIVQNPVPGIRSLRCIDLTRHQFFNPTPPPPTIGVGSESAAAQDSCCSPKHPAAGAFNLKNKHADGPAAFTTERFQLPDPTFNFRAQAESHGWNIDCFPLAGRKVICVDQSGRAFLFDADTRQLVTMPSLHKPKWSPFSVFVPSTDEDAEHDDDGGSGSGRLYVMEKNPRSEAGCPVQHSDQFEAFVFHKPTETSSSSTFESWHCQLLPPPPFIRDYAYSQKRHNITSYSVVGDSSSHILISAEDVGTYCLDTASNIWSRVGEWTLPFCGKLEYVPELKLWFGLSAEDQHLAAVDLSAMDSKPQLVGSWKEFEPRWEWEESQGSQLVNLGSGRFCIARFFEAMELGGEFGNELVEQSFVVLTGVEVKLAVNDANCSGSGNSKTKLEVATHKSQFHMSNGAVIYAVF